MFVETEEGINTLPDMILLKIFQYFTEQDLCRISNVCKRFQKIADNTSLWQSLYKKVYEYDQPLFYLESETYQFESPNVSKYNNPWRESFKQLYRGVHVRPGFENLTFEGHNLQYFDTIQGALHYVKNNRNDAFRLRCSDQHLIFVHSATHNIDCTIRMESNVALIGAAPGTKHQIAESVIINSNVNNIYIRPNLKLVYVGCITLQLIAATKSLFNCLYIAKNSTPIIDHCIFKSNINYAAVCVSGVGANPLVKNCIISDCKSTGLHVINEAQGIYEDNTISRNANYGVLVSDNARPVMCRNNIHHNGFGIDIYKGETGYFENNEIHDNKTGFQISSSLPQTIRGNKIYNNLYNGLIIQHKTSGLIENNNIYNNVYIGIRAVNGSNIIVRHNKIFRNNCGISMQNCSTSIIDTNEVYMNSLKNCYIINSKSILKKNRIYGGLIGVFFTCFSGRLEQNDIYDHKIFGVKISAGSNPEILHNKIWDNQNGVIIGRSSGLLEQNYIFNNTINNVIIIYSNPVIQSNQIFGAQHCGISILSNSKGVVRGNCIFKNIILGINVSIDSQPILIENNIFCNGESVRIIGTATAAMESNTIF